MPEPRRHFESGETGPIRIDESAKYGKRKKTDEDRFDCQRYAMNPRKGFDKTIKKIKEKK